MGSAEPEILSPDQGVIVELGMPETAKKSGLRANLSLSIRLYDASYPAPMDQLITWVAKTTLESAANG